MSLFGGLSTQSKDATTTSATEIEANGLPCFKFSDLVNKDEIGRGGFATVFTAELSSGGQNVVVKTFRDIEAESRKRLFKEAKRLNSLVHPNIIEFKGVCNDHRDLKPPNILVSNQHYCQLSDHVEIETISSKMPIVCKLTDFGESRSQDIHTNTVLSSKTT